MVDPERVYAALFRGIESDDVANGGEVTLLLLLSAVLWVKVARLMLPFRVSLATLQRLTRLSHL